MVKATRGDILLGKSDGEGTSGIPGVIRDEERDRRQGQELFAGRKKEVVHSRVKFAQEKMSFRREIEKSARFTFSDITGTFSIRENLFR